MRVLSYFPVTQVILLCLPLLLQGSQVDTGIYVMLFSSCPPGLLRCSVTQPTAPVLRHGLAKHFLLCSVPIDQSQRSRIPTEAKLPLGWCRVCVLWTCLGREAAEGVLQEHVQLCSEFCPLGLSLVRVPLLTYVTRFVAEEMTGLFIRGQ